MRCTAMRLMPCTWAMERTLQWVAPGRVVSRVAWSTRRTFAAHSLGLRPGRGASFSMPAMPSAAKRSRHNYTVSRDRPRATAITWFCLP